MKSVKSVNVMEEGSVNCEEGKYLKSILSLEACPVYFLEHSVDVRVQCVHRSKQKRMYKVCLLRTDFLYISYSVVILSQFSLTHVFLCPFSWPEGIIITN